MIAKKSKKILLFLFAMTLFIYGCKGCRESQQNLSDPLPKNIVDGMTEMFDLTYRQGINTSIKSQDFSIKWNDLGSYVPLSFLQNKIDTGIALYYLINDADAQNKYFTYAITMAYINHEQSGDKIMPIFNFGTNKYLFFTQNGHDTIGAQTLNRYRKAYVDSVNVRDLSPSRTYQIKQLNHPLISFHSGANFYKFYTDNAQLTGGNITNFYLTVRNGATYNDSIYNYQYNYRDTLHVQCPILVCKNGASIFLGVGLFDGTYKNRALDVGRLCPPQCN